VLVKLFLNGNFAAILDFDVFPPSVGAGFAMRHNRRCRYGTQKNVEVQQKTDHAIRVKYPSPRGKNGGYTPALVQMTVTTIAANAAGQRNVIVRPTVNSKEVTIALLIANQIVASIFLPLLPESIASIAAATRGVPR
jgi:hypothetical protein